VTSEAFPCHAVTLHTLSPPAMSGSVYSLDSTSSASLSDGYDSEDEYMIAQREWEESLEQLKQLASIVLMPFVGRWLGRKWSFWGKYAKVLRKP
jgi:hypothetical protein